MKIKITLLLLLCGLVSSLEAQSNLSIDQSYTVEQMVMDFFNHPDITISNVSFTGDAESYGFFDSGEPSETVLEVGAGIFIGSGYAWGAIGPNNEDGFSQITSGGFDSDLSIMGSGQTYNSSVITFNLTASTEILLDFNYMFGSEEYCEFVNSQYNDVFGFFVSGPGITGPFSNNGINIATVPGAADYVGINTINHLMNSDLFIPNSLDCGVQPTDPINLQYDGFTSPLSASFLAIAGETYEIRLGVADVGDQVYDSGVFLAFNSLSMDSVLVPPAQFTAASTFTNGAEFVNNSKYATSYLWDFGNGMTSTDKNPGPITYATAGTYEVSLTTQNYCCTDVATQTISVGQVAITVNSTTLNNPLTCPGDNNGGIVLELSGGVGPYNVSWTPTTSDLMSLSAGTYNILITDAEGDTTSTSITISEPDPLVIDMAGTMSTPELDGQSDGTATIAVSGGTPPYSYEWENGETSATIENLEAGNYGVTATDFNGCMYSFVIGVSGATNIVEQNGFELYLFPNPAKDHLTINWAEKADIDFLTVYDVLGKNVGVNYSQSGGQINVDFENQPAVGIYYLRIQLADGRSGIERFMIR